MKRVLIPALAVVALSLAYVRAADPTNLPTTAYSPKDTVTQLFEFNKNGDVDDAWKYILGPTTSPTTQQRDGFLSDSRKAASGGLKVVAVDALVKDDVAVVIIRHEGTEDGGRMDMLPLVNDGGIWKILLDPSRVDPKRVDKIQGLMEQASQTINAPNKNPATTRSAD